MFKIGYFRNVRGLLYSQSTIALFVVLFCFVLLMALFKKTFRKLFIDSEVEYGIILFIFMFLVTVSS